MKKAIDFSKKNNKINKMQIKIDKTSMTTLNANS